MFKDFFNAMENREIQKFNVSLTFSIMKKIIALLGVIGVIHAISYSYVYETGVENCIAIVIGIILLVQLLLLPGYIAQYKASPRTTAIFVLGIILWLLPISWPAALVWACAEPKYDIEVKSIEKDKYMMFQYISSVLIVLTAFFFYFVVWQKQVVAVGKIKAQEAIIEKAVNVYHGAVAEDLGKTMGISKKCAYEYEESIREGEHSENIAACTKDEMKAINKYDAEQEYDYQEPLFTNNSMPKSLVLAGVPIMCFEKANLGDNTKCSKRQLESIKSFFKDSDNIDWSEEYFSY